MSTTVTWQSKSTPISRDHGLDAASNSGAEPNCRIPTIVTMSVSVDCDESYLGQNLSISQLLHAAKMKLQSTAFSEWFVWWLVGERLPRY